MPLTHVRAFRVRHYECDVYDLLRTAVYLRYLQETAFDASAAAGYDQSRYQAMRRIWLIRETNVRFWGVLHAGETVEVATWVMDFRKVRSRRAYEMRRVENGELVAKGYTDWAFLDMDSGRPAVIPDELIAAFFPEDAPANSQPRERFPSLTPPVDAFLMERRVEWRDLDGAGHVNNAVYADYVDEARRAMLGSRGWSSHRPALIPQQLRIEYRQPALFEDGLEITVWTSEATAGAATHQATVVRSSDAALLAQACTRWGTVDSPSETP